jgi:hypothetical protein
MAPITHTDTFTVSLDVAQVRERVLAWFASVSFKVADDTPDRLEVKSGSQAKMRGLGGAFIAATSLPTRTVITMVPSGATTEVTVTASDAVGIGAKTGMKAKYDGWTSDIVSGLRTALAGPASSG